MKLWVWDWKSHHYSEETKQVGNLALSEDVYDGEMHGQDPYVSLRGKKITEARPYKTYWNLNYI